MRTQRKITKEKVAEVKDKLQRNTIRGAARYCGVSFYTAYCVSKGLYDTDEPLQQKRQLFKRCPITGYQL